MINELLKRLIAVDPHMDSAQYIATMQSIQQETRDLLKSFDVGDIRERLEAIIAYYGLDHQCWSDDRISGIYRDPDEFLRSLIPLFELGNDNALISALNEYYKNSDGITIQIPFELWLALRNYVEGK